MSTLKTDASDQKTGIPPSGQLVPSSGRRLSMLHV